MTESHHGRRRILVTGVTSGIMQAVLAEPAFEGDEIVGLSRKEADTSDHIRLIRGDLNEPGSYRSALAGVDVVIHAAALTHARIPAAYYQVNRDATAILVEESRKQQVGRFVFISSRAAVSGAGGYGESKLAAEAIVREGFPDHLIYRPAEVFGVTRYEGIEKLIRDAIHGGVQLYPAGVTAPLCPIHVDDVAADIAGSVFDPEPSERTLTLSGPSYYRYPELIRSVAGWAGSSVWLVPLPRAVVALATALLNAAGSERGPVPDQIPRLYADKGPTASRTGPVRITLKDYVESLLSKPA